MLIVIARLTAIGRGGDRLLSIAQVGRVRARTKGKERKGRERKGKNQGENADLWRIRFELV